MAQSAQSHAAYAPAHVCRLVGVLPVSGALTEARHDSLSRPMQVLRSPYVAVRVAGSHSLRLAQRAVASAVQASSAEGPASTGPASSPGPPSIPEGALQPKTNTRDARAMHESLTMRREHTSRELVTNKSREGRTDPRRAGFRDRLLPRDPGVVPPPESARPCCAYGMDIGVAIGGKWCPATRCST